MIELNLLPDIKLQFIKARRTKRLIIGVSFVASAASLAIFIFFLLYVNVFQKARINSLNNQVNTTKAQLSNDTNLNKVLTIQNQLNTLPNIYNQLPQTNRIFTYLDELIPNNASVSSFNISYATGAVSMTGSASNATTVNQLIDTLNYAQYNLGTSTSYPAFSKVVVGSISVTSQSQGSGSSGGASANSTSYSVTFNVDPKLFNPLDNVTMTVPNKTTTGSIINQPTNLFKPANGG